MNKSNMQELNKKMYKDVKKLKPLLDEYISISHETCESSTVDYSKELKKASIFAQKASEALEERMLYIIEHYKSLEPVAEECLYRAEPKKRKSRYIYFAIDYALDHVYAPNICASTIKYYQPSATEIARAKTHIYNATKEHFMHIYKSAIIGFYSTPYEDVFKD